MKNRFLNQKPYVMDPWLTLVVALLTVFGLLAVASATAGEQMISSRLKMQMLATGIGLLLWTGISLLDLRMLKQWGIGLYIGCVFQLIFVLLFGSGKEQTGANSWVRFGPVGIQPSEPIKVVFALVFGEMIASAKRSQTLNRPRKLLGLCAAFLLICGLVILQNDTGTALVFVFMFCVMLFAGGLHLRYFAGAIGVFLAAIPVVWACLAPYQKSRIIVFFRPETDPAGAGYQVLQSKLSIASGGLYGRGFWQGRNNRFDLLPEKETDFIFGVIGEEFGFFGCALVVLLLFFLCVRCFRIGQRAGDLEGRLICTGIGAMFLFHTVENICMCIGLLPVTGIPLPFLSYGGSAQVTAFLAVGVLQNVYVASHNFRFYKN